MAQHQEKWAGGDPSARLPSRRAWSRPIGLAEIEAEARFALCRADSDNQTFVQIRRGVSG